MGLRAGGATLPSVFIPRLAAGRYALTVTVDPDGLLQDRNRANNTLHLALDVTDRTVDVFPSNFSVIAAKPFLVKRRPDERRNPVPPSRERPDLRALPATGVYTFTNAGRDRLRFDAAVWNAGTRLVIEARRADRRRADARRLGNGGAPAVHARRPCRC